MNSGGQPGNNNPGKGKRWANAIQTALNKRCKSDGQNVLVEIAETLIDKALDGELIAIKEIGDRLDGRPQQSVVGIDDGPVIIEIRDRAGKPTE